MSLKLILMTAVAVSIIAAPISAEAAANPAASLSLVKASRTGSPSAKTNKAAGTGLLVSLGISIAAAVAGYLVVDKIIDDNKDDNDDDADSN